MMALDIQPLSPQRRAVMLLVLLGLFGLSLGFAQFLVGLRHQGWHYTVAVRMPPGFTEPVEAYDKLDGVVMSASGEVDEKTRRIVVFSYDVSGSWESGTGRTGTEALEIFSRVLGEPVHLPLKAAVLGGAAGVEVGGEYGEEENPMFLVERMAVFPGHVVAICFSGAGRLTDADRALFNAICELGVTIRTTPRTATK